MCKNVALVVLDNILLLFCHLGKLCSPLKIDMPLYCVLEKKKKPKEYVTQYYIPGNIFGWSWVESNFLIIFQSVPVINLALAGSIIGPMGGNSKQARWLRLKANISSTTASLNSFWRSPFLKVLGEEHIAGNECEKFLGFLRLYHYALLYPLHFKWLSLVQVCLLGAAHSSQ